MAAGGGGLAVGAGAECWLSPCLIIRFRRTSMTCSAGRDAARVEAMVLPTVAGSVPVVAGESEGEGGVRPSVAVSVAVPVGAVGNEDDERLP